MSLAELIPIIRALSSSEKRSSWICSKLSLSRRIISRRLAA